MPPLRGSDPSSSSSNSNNNNNGGGGGGGDSNISSERKQITSVQHNVPEKVGVFKTVNKATDLSLLPPSNLFKGKCYEFYLLH